VIVSDNSKLLEYFFVSAIVFFRCTLDKSSIPMGRKNKKSVRLPKRRPRSRKSGNIIQFHRGHVVSVPNHPTEFCSSPWFPLCLRIEAPGTVVTFGDLHTAFNSQLSGLALGSQSLYVRILGARVWGPIPPTPSRLTVAFRDVFSHIDPAGPTAVLDVLEEVTDYADGVNRARVGYVYSTAQQSTSLVCAATSSVAFLSTTGAGTGAVAYINILFRAYQTAFGYANQDDESDDEGDVLSESFERFEIGTARNNDARKDLVRHADAFQHPSSFTKTASQSHSTTPMSFPRRQ